MAEYALSSVDIVNFSSSVICFAMSLLIFVRRAPEILSIVSEYRRARSVNDSTHAKSVILGRRTALRMSFHV
jgi:hypothetical protein